ncbi:MAG: phage holin family protein [Deltaproteobacteria bacterium]
MPGIVIRWLILTLAILILPYLISGVRVEGFGTALAAAAILAVLNAIVRPVLIILTLPLTVVTLGLFILIINALLFELAGFFVPGLQIASFWSALFGSIIVSIISWIMNFAVAGGGWERKVVVRRKRDSKTYEMHRGRDGKWE